MNAREIVLHKCAIQESLYYNKMHRYLFTNSSMQSTSYIPSKYFSYTFRFKSSGNDFIELLCRSIFAMQTKNISRFKRKYRGHVDLNELFRIKAKS